MLKRNVPLKRTGFAPKPRKQMSRTRLRKVSPKRAKLDSKYSRLKREFMARPENAYCPVAMAGLVESFANGKVPHWRFTQDVHHTWLRGKYYLDTSTWLAVSRNGHDWIGNNKAQARVRGWLCDTKETREAWLKKILKSSCAEE